MQALGPYSQKVLMLGLFVMKFQPILMFDLFVLVRVASQWQRAFKNKTLCEFDPGSYLAATRTSGQSLLKESKDGHSSDPPPVRLPLISKGKTSCQSLPDTSTDRCLRGYIVKRANVFHLV